MNKYIIAAFGVLILIAASVLFYYYKDTSEKTSIDVEAAGTKGDSSNQTEAKSELEKRFEQETPQDEMPNYKKMSEKELLNEVHEMTHQKVKAEQKWGASEITKDKVAVLYDIIKARDFKDGKIKSMLLDILEPWLSGNFTNAVTAHNSIWTYQDGNVGKATRLLTPEEEEKFVHQYFH